MTVKLILLKSGEDIIADVEEMVVNERVVGYFFNHPCRVKLIGNEVTHVGNKKLPFKMRLTPWMPLSKDQKIPVVTDWVVSIVEPLDELVETYKSGVADYEKRKSEVVDLDEQPETDDSD